jgi:lactoylglutathione lyase
MISGLDHVHIMCRNLEKAVQYFESLFGGKVESRTELRGFPMVRMHVQGVHVNLHKTDSKAAAFEPGKATPGLDHFGFLVKGLERVVEDLKKKGGRFSVDFTQGAGGVKFAFIDGPEGIRIELIERP